EGGRSSSLSDRLLTCGPVPLGQPLESSWWRFFSACQLSPCPRSWQSLRAWSLWSKPGCSLGPSTFPRQPSFLWQFPWPYSLRSGHCFLGSPQQCAFSCPATNTPVNVSGRHIDQDDELRPVL